MSIKKKSYPIYLRILFTVFAYIIISINLYNYVDTEDANKNTQNNISDLSSVKQTMVADSVQNTFLIKK